MPVTAKLSRKFYEKLGEDIANELVDWFNAVDATYKADLRELNELNFTRFEAKLAQGLAEVKGTLQSEIAQGLASLETKLVRWMVGLWATALLAMIGLSLRR